MTEAILRRARDLLETKTPLKTDCGRCCGGACCAADEDGNGGVRLFPGEEALYRDCGWARVEKGLLVCEGECERAKRPLGCRIFPLTARFDGEGRMRLRMDARARALCPLVASGVKGLDVSFRQAVREALTLVADDPEGAAFLRAWQAEEEAFDITASRLFAEAEGSIMEANSSEKSV